MKVRDGKWELWKHDFHTGVTTWHYFDGERNHWRTDYPVEGIVDDNKRLAAERAGKQHVSGVGELVARVPLNIAFEQLNEAAKQRDDKYMSRWLNDSDNAAWRVRGGRV